MLDEASKIVYSNLAADLQAAIQWLDGLGIVYSATRFGSYQKTLSQLESARLAGIDLNQAAAELNAFAPLFEANELVTICGRRLRRRMLRTFITRSTRCCRWIFRSWASYMAQTVASADDSCETPADRVPDASLSA